MFDITINLDCLNEARSRNFNAETFMDGDDILTGTMVHKDSNRKFEFGIYARSFALSGVDQRALSFESYVSEKDDDGEVYPQNAWDVNPLEMMNFSNEEIISRLIATVTDEINEAYGFIIS